LNLQLFLTGLGAHSNKLITGLPLNKKLKSGITYKVPPDTEINTLNLDQISQKVSDNLSTVLKSELNIKSIILLLADLDMKPTFSESG